MKKLMAILAGIVLTTGMSMTVYAGNGQGNNGNGNGNGGSNPNNGGNPDSGPVTGGDTQTASHDIALTIETLALIDIEAEGNNINISLNPAAPTEAGLGYDFSNSENNDLWLNYSSIVKKDQSREITAALDGNFPEGITLSVSAANAHS